MWNLFVHETEPASYRNGNNGDTIHQSDSLEEDLQRAISTAERRKVTNRSQKKKIIQISN